MIIYIKDKKDFRNKVLCTAVAYEIHESIYDTVSTITIPTPKEIPQEGDFVMFDGMNFVGLITEVDIDGGQTELSVEQAVKLFSREIFYTAATYTYLEDHLKDLIDTNYTNCTDEVYRLPFLEVNALTQTNRNCKPDLEDNVFTIKSYIGKLRRLQDIVCDWSFNRTTLTVDIYKKTFQSHNIDMSNPRYKITEQTLSSLSVGKITVYCEENGNYYTRYLKTDGTITPTYSTTDRVEGEWKTLTINEYADLDDSVADEFAQNFYSHKVSFITDKEFGLYDRLNLRIDGKIFNSYVSGLIYTDKSDYHTVECGELQTQYPFLERL